MSACSRLPLSEDEERASLSWTRAQVLASWGRIFDLDRLAASGPDWYGGTGAAVVQATLEEVHAEEVFFTRVYPPRPLPRWLPAGARP